MKVSFARLPSSQHRKTILLASVMALALAAVLIFGGVVARSQIAQAPPLPTDFEPDPSLPPELQEQYKRTYSADYNATVDHGGLEPQPNTIEPRDLLVNLDYVMPSDRAKVRALIQAAQPFQLREAASPQGSAFLELAP